MRFRPFRADNIFGGPFPGRCSGLSHPAPLGLKTDFVIIHSSKDSFSTSNALHLWGLKLITLSHILLELLFLQAMLSPLGLKTDFVITHYRLARKRKRVPNLEPLSELIFNSDLVFAPKGHNEIAQGNALGK